MSIIFLKLFVCDTLKSCNLAIHTMTEVSAGSISCRNNFSYWNKKNTFFKTIIIKHDWEEASLSQISTHLIQFADCDTRFLNRLHMKTKRRRSDSVLWQKPLHPRKCQKGKVTTQTTPQNSSIKPWLPTDLGRSVGVITATKLVWLTWFTGPTFPHPATAVVRK